MKLPALFQHKGKPNRQWRKFRKMEARHRDVHHVWPGSAIISVNGVRVGFVTSFTPSKD